MRRFLVRFIRPESFVHNPSSAGFTIATSEFEFSVHTAVEIENGEILRARYLITAVGCLSSANFNLRDEKSVEAVAKGSKNQAARLTLEDVLSFAVEPVSRRFRFAFAYFLIQRRNA